MMLTNRRKSILEAIIREYVATAEPVSSGELARKYELACSPATVRNEMLELDRDGFILQPHTSSGRIPTDKGYRFFIEYIEAEDGGERRRLERSLVALRSIEDEFDFLRQASRLLSQFSKEFSMAGFANTGVLYKSGLAEVLREPEFEDELLAEDFGELVDFLDDEMQHYFRTSDTVEPRVFIGDENPIREARNYSMIVTSVSTPFDEESLFAILGPRRMDYRKNMALLKAMQRIFN